MRVYIIKDDTDIVALYLLAITLNVDIEGDRNVDKFQLSFIV